MSQTEERFLLAALAEDGMQISTGYAPASSASERFLTAAIAEDGLPVSVCPLVPDFSLAEEPVTMPDPEIPLNRM